ncbi:MAG: FAD:protein FMN transferase [Actinomycetota bacterium]
MLEVGRSVGFRAMGTDVRVFVQEEAAEGLVARVAEIVRAEFEEQEGRFSRFRGDSELSRVNASDGRTSDISSTFAEVVAMALRAAEASGGRFDPTVLGAVVAAGYDRDFDDVVAGARDVLHPARPADRWREVILEGDRITLPTDAGLDLGGIVKGWTCDRASALALDAGLAWVLVDAGGDLRLMGDAPRIAVGVEDPDDPARTPFMRIGIEDGALATSSTTRRRWGHDAHHLIDPRTSLPSRTGVAQATAWAATCAEAEVAAKELLLGGEDDLDRIPGVLVLEEGRVVTSLAEAA